MRRKLVDVEQHEVAATALDDQGAVVLRRPATSTFEPDRKPPVRARAVMGQTAAISSRPASRRAGALLAIALAAAGALPAQTTLVVGPGGFGQIGDAIQAARPGDTVLVTASARYDHFTLDRGVTIRVAAGVRALVSNGFSAPLPRNTTIRIPPGQTGELVGLLWAPELPLLGYLGIGQVRVIGGTAVFRDCSLEGQTNGCGRGWPALEIEDATVGLQLCRLRGHDRHGVALVARRAIISAFDSTFTGGDGCWDSYAYGAHGVQLEASRMHASRVVIDGGSSPPLNPNYDAGHGIVIDPTSSLWIAHAIVTGGDGGPSGGRGGDGIRNLSSAPVRAVRLSATGGQGTPPGSPITGPLVVDPSLVVAWASPVEPRLGTTWTLRFQLAANTPIVALFGLRLDPIATAATVEPFWLAAAPAPISWATVVSGPQGDAAVAVAIPNLPALRGARLWFQGAVPISYPFQLTPLLGGQIW